MGKENGFDNLSNNKMELFFEYTSGDVLKDSDYYVIDINPIIPVVIITKANDKSFVDKYY